MSPEPLPGPVRLRLVALASDRLAGLAGDQVPPSLRPFRRFAPRKRAQLAAVPLAVALEQDAVFRQLVAEGLGVDLVEAVRAGLPLPAAPAEDLAAAVYLLRPDGWQELLAAEVTVVVAHEAAEDRAVGLDAVQRLTEQLEAVRQQSRVEVARLTEALEASEAEATALLRRVRETGSRAAAAERALASAQSDAATGAAADPASRSGAGAGAGGAGAAGGPGSAAADGPADPAEVRRLRARLRAAEQALTAARTSVRGDRAAESVRLRVLLDALVGVAGGLRRELALPPLQGSPADAVAASYDTAGTGSPARRGRSLDDPRLLDELLLVPTTHLLIDGYNVTKAGYGERPLEVQRARLVSGLGALVARTGAEITVVFDGAGQDEVRPAGGAVPRGVRVVFSPVGVIADDVLLELLGVEPAGRPLVMVSSDGEVADGARRHGAHAVPSTALLALLDRRSDGLVGPRP